MYKVSFSKIFSLSIFWSLLVICAMAQTSSYFLHTVKEGETLATIAKENKTTVGTLIRLNGYNAKSVLRKGKSIKIPMTEATESAKTIDTPIAAPINATVIAPKNTSTAPTTDESDNYSTDTIKEGETLSAIAKANSTTVGDIMRLNGMNTKSILKVGAEIKLPKKGEKIPVNTNIVAEKTTTPVPVAKPVITAPVVTESTSEEQTGFTLHTIKAGETLSTIAKANKTKVGDIMRLNGMNTKSILKAGASIKIPSKDVKTEVIVPEKEVVVAMKTVPVVKEEERQTPDITIPNTKTLPIEYTVAKGDNLYRLSKTYKTTEAQLMKWNGMKNDLIRPGQIIIVGQDSSAELAIPERKPNKSTYTPAVNKPKKSLPFVARDTTKVVKDSTVIVMEDTDVMMKPRNVKFTARDTTTQTQTREMSVVADPPPIAKYARFVNEEGFYAGYFNRKNISNNSTTGDGGTFKSTSGWNDKKFYILINDINQGTIVRITANNKSVCAKVMGPLPNIKEDLGLVARLNAAAADALGIQDAKFSVLVNY